MFPLNLNVGWDGGEWSPERPRGKECPRLTEQGGGRAIEPTRVAPQRRENSLASVGN